MGNVAIPQRSVCKTGLRYSGNCWLDIIPLMKLTELTELTELTDQTDDVLVMDVNEFFEELLQEVDEIIGTRSKQQTQNTGENDEMSTKFLDGFLVDEEGVNRKLKAKYECDGNLGKRHTSNSLDSFLAHDRILKNVSTQTDGESSFALRGLNVPVQTDVGGRTIKNDILIKFISLLPKLHSHELEALYSFAELLFEP
uniref:Uncharacterized protein n=1 Tax=Glossina pallidipes TaxID=7398 RepID=A0A1B0A2W4_GLOPL